MEQEVKPGQIYRHWKGGLYRVICLANMEATGEKQVVYANSQGENFVRPLRGWFEVLGDEPTYFYRFSPSARKLETSNNFCAD